MSNKSTSQSGRYVFFKSLSQTPEGWLYPALPDAISRLNALQGNIGISTAYNKDSDQFIERIQKYLDFIQSMAANLKSNELAFLDQQKQLLLQEKDEKSQELVKALETLKNQQTDYLTIMSIMNSLMQNQEQYNYSIQNQIERMTQAKETWENFDSNEWLVKMYEQEYKKYSGIFASNIKKQHNTKITQIVNGQKVEKVVSTYKASFSEQLAKRANEILANLSTNETFINQLVTALSAQDLKVSDNDIKEIIINIISDQVINSSINDDAMTILDRILSAMQNPVSAQELINSVSDAEFSRIVVADFTPFEQLVLTSGKGIAAHIRQLDDRSITNIIKQYPETANLIRILRDMNDKQFSKAQSLKSKLTTIIKNSVKARAEKELQIKIEKDPMPKAEFKEKLGRIKNFITPTQFKTTLRDALKGVHFSHDIIGEILASNDVRNQLRNIIVNNLPGISISFKADIRYSTGYVGSKDIEPSDEDFSLIRDAINEVLREHYSSFLEKYKEVSGGATDVAIAEQVYKEWLSEMKAHFDSIIDQDEKLSSRFQDRTLLYKQFYETFSNSVSVKDYSLYNNSLGFHGGSLGSHTAPEKVIDNITKMYELGGISSADAEELLFAVLNCGATMIGSNIKTSLETYLLGGAALIMFDDSFAASDTFLQGLLDEFRGQKIVNLYRINTFYVPASYILEEIHSNLVKIYQDLSSEINTLDQHNRVTIINNVEYSEEIAKGDTPQARAEAMSSYAQSNIDIQFSFMGGLLDVLENLPKITNIR